MIQAHEDALQVRLTPDDVESAQMAGVRFARALAGAPSAAFMLALAEQEQLVRSAIEDARVSERVARIAAEAFEAGAMMEWGRITLAAGCHGQRMSTLRLPTRTAAPPAPSTTLPEPRWSSRTRRPQKRRT